MIVKCPQCGVSYYETTDQYDPNKAPNGSMLRLREPWRSLGWSTYGLDRGDGKTILFADMECVGCAAPLCPGGKLKVVGAPVAPAVPKVVDSPVTKTEQIKSLLRETDLTQTAIAQQVGTSPQYVNRVARGA